MDHTNSHGEDTLWSVYLTPYEFVGLSYNLTSGEVSRALIVVARSKTQQPVTGIVRFPSLTTTLQKI
jgi:hypothetical protein